MFILFTCSLMNRAKPFKNAAQRVKKSKLQKEHAGLEPNEQVFSLPTFPNFQVPIGSIIPRAPFIRLVRRVPHVFPGHPEAGPPNPVLAKPVYHYARYQDNNKLCM